MGRQVWDNLLDEVRSVHASVDALCSFCDFPDDLQSQTVEQRWFPCADLMARERNLNGKEFTALRSAFMAAGPYAHWRETYRETDIGDDFMDRFGCYNLIGTGGAFMSQKMWAWVVYMPPKLDYPWHHHPGEETYFVIDGEAEFRILDQPSRILRAGDTSRHGSNQPHAMETYDKPVMALVIWRNGFDTPPVLTKAEQMRAT